MTTRTREYALNDMKEWQRNVTEPLNAAGVRHVAAQIEETRIAAIMRTGYADGLTFSEAKGLRLLAEQLDKANDRDAKLAELRDLNGAAELLLQDKDAKLAEAGVKIVQLEKANEELGRENTRLHREWESEQRAYKAAHDEIGALEGEKDRLKDRVRQYARERDAAQRIVFSLGQKLRDARARLGNAYRELAGASEDGSDISVVFRYREGSNGGISVEDASDLAVAMGVQFEAEVEGLDEPENEGSDQVA